MIDAPALTDRVARSRMLLDALGLDALLVSRNANKRYLSGFTIARGDEGTSGYSGTLLLTRDAQILLADGRYMEQATDEAPGWEVRRTRGRLATEVADLFARVGTGRCGVEARVVSHAEWTALTEAAPGVELEPLDDALAELRLRKEPAELAALERACSLTDACFAHLLATVQRGMTEQQVAWELEDWFRHNGAEDLAFEPLVLVGARAAMPHGAPSAATLREGEPLLIDFGCQVDGYRSDMTRTIFVGEPSLRQRELYAIVLAAQQAAYDALRPGVIGAEVDRAARDVIERAGFGEAFSHGLGHGIGLETHEAPSLLSYQEALRSGMVFTLEPGIYLPGEIGIRIEDDYLLTADGPRRLTSAPRELIVI